MKHIDLRRIALGKQPYAERYLLRGKNTGLSNSLETVWTPGATYAQLTTAAALEIVSSDANDTSAGTGARTVYADLVDSNWDRKIFGNATGVEVAGSALSMNGATPVAITGTYFGVNRMRVETAGSGNVNAGNVDIRTVTGSTVKRRISSVAGIGQGEDADFLFTVPRKHIALIRDVHFSVKDAGDEATVTLRVRNSSGVLRVLGERLIGSDTVAPYGFGVLHLGEGQLVEEKSLIELTATMDGGAASIVAHADLYLFNVEHFGIL